MVLKGSAQRYIRHSMWSVSGWLSQRDAFLISTICAAQKSLDVRGDILEIGAYFGKTSILLGYLLDQDELLHVCDIFEAKHLASSASAADTYASLARSKFESNYSRFHDSIPVVHQMASTQLRESWSGSARFVHVDGAHDFVSVQSDINVALESLVEGGVLAFDDFRSLHTPGVSAAFWEAVAGGRLGLLAMTKTKAYACRSGDAIAHEVLELGLRMQTNLEVQLRVGVGPCLVNVPVVGVTPGLGFIVSCTSIVQWWRSVRHLIRRLRPVGVPPVK